MVWYGGKEAHDIGQLVKFMQTKDGGLGLINIRLFNVAMKSKLAWRLISKNDKR